MSAVVLDASSFSIELDERTGDLRALRWREPSLDLIRDDRLGENFRILLPRADYEAAYFNSRDQSVKRVERDSTGVTCFYERLRNDSEEVEVDVRYRIDFRHRGLEFSIAIDNRTDRPLAEVFFGVLGGLQGIGARGASRSMFPGGHDNLAPDVFNDFPAGEYGGGNLGIPYSACGFVYPGYAGLTMAWCDLYNTHTGTGLYYGLHDPEARLSAVYLELRPYSTSAVVGSNWPRDEDLPDDEPRGLTMGWLNFPYTRRGTVELGPIRVEAHKGDWRSGSRIYRTWFDRHFPIPAKGWLRDEQAWQSTILLNPEDVAVHRFDDLGQMALDAKSYDITVFEICGWDVGGIDRGYPDYRPDPRLGSRDDFRAGLAAIRGEGVKPIVFANVQVADTATDAYMEEMSAYATHGRSAADLHLLGFGEGTMGARLGLAASNMAVVSPAHPHFRASIVEQMTDLVRDGAAALQLDKTIVLQYLDFNPRVPTSPDRSLPAGLLDTLSEVLAAGRQVDTDFALASEVWWDRTFPFIDVMYTRIVGIDIPSPSLLYTFPEVASTVFAENPADFNVMSNGMRYGMVWALAPRHYMRSVAERLTQPLARYVRELVRIRGKHSDLLFHGRFLDTEDASIEPHPTLRYSVFRSRDAADPRRACVLVNYGDEDVETTVDFEGREGAVEICQPFLEDRQVELPATVKLAPRSCAVVIDRP